MRILLIEDDAMLGDGISRSLRDGAHAVDWVRDGVSAGAHWSATDYDLLLLDLGLPRKDGLTVLREGRARGLSTNVLILTARDEVQDRVAGLDAGADDYLVKPFDIDELLARIRALGRRRAGLAESRVEHLGLATDFGSRETTYHGQPVAFTRREYALLTALVEQPGRVWTKEQLVERLYGWDEGIASNALEVHIHAIRKKTSADFIRNARGVGYFTPKS